MKTTNTAVMEFEGDNSSVEKRKSFVDAILRQNPFENSRLSDPSQMMFDVASIHAEEFARIRDESEAAARDVSKGRGLLLLGSAGAGKSHLMVRLGRWAAEQTSCFVYLHNIQVEPQDLPRYLLKCCVNRLANDRRDRFHETPLYRIFEQAFRSAAKSEGITTITEQTSEEVFRKLFQRLGHEETVFRVIYKFFCGAYYAHHSTNPARRIAQAQVAETAVRWLKGEVLDRDEAGLIDVRVRPNQDSVELGAELIPEVWRTIADLAQDAGCKFIVCLDQIDNMRPEQLAELARVAQALIDGVPNLLMLLAGVDHDVFAFLDQGLITSAASARLQGHRPMHLKLIDVKSARILLETRLQQLTDEPARPDTKPFFQDDGLFPLGSAWFEHEFADTSVLSPRTVFDISGRNSFGILERLTFAKQSWKFEFDHPRSSVA